MIENFLSASIAGTIVGFFSGLVPGLHQNLLIPIFLILLSNFDKFFIISFLVSFAISQNYGNAISSYLLSSPPEDLSLSSLPSQRLAKQGLLLESLKIFVLASAISIPLNVLVTLVLHKYLSILVGSLKKYIGIILLIAIYTILFYEEDKIRSLIIFLVSGILGLYAFNILEFNKAVLALFSGFFALSQIILNLIQNVDFLKEQREDVEVRLPKDKVLIGSLVSVFVGVFSGLLPSLGTSQILLLFQPIMDDRLFIFTSAASSFSNEIFSTTSLYTIQNPRSGLGVYLEESVGKFEFTDFIICLSSFLITGSLSILIFIWTYKKIFNILKRINFKILNTLILATIISIVFYFSGFLGLLILFASTSLGILTISLNVKRSYLMGSLIFSTILIYTGTYQNLIQILKL